ncbi:MAG: AsnC family transcriptional regulator, partial [Candidatus Micrarchaeaceae archaeon]
MQELPKAVEETFEKLKQNRKWLRISLIKGHYYVYEETSRRENNKTKTFSLYLGKIKEDGSFEAVKRRKREHTKVNSLEELLRIAEVGGLREILYPGESDLKILEMLSTDARIAQKKIANAVGLSEAAVQHRIERLEQRYGIRYTIEIAPRPFGYFRYICLVKFLKGKPDLDEVKKVLEAEPAVLYAAELKGDYDLFIYMLAENTKVLEDKLYEIRSKPAFALN